MDKVKISEGKQNCKIIGKKKVHKPLPPIIPGVRANHFPHDCLGTRDHSPNTALGPPAPVSLHDGFLYSLVYKQCSGGGGLALGDVNNCYQNKIRQKEG